MSGLRQAAGRAFEGMNRRGIVIVGVLFFAGLMAWRLAHHATEAERPTEVPHAAMQVESSETVADEPAVRQAAPTGAADEGSSETAVTLTDEISAQAMMFTLFSRLEQPLRLWAESRGLPRVDANGNFMLDQPYQQYDQDTLTALADNGDMWAQQILAERIQRERPAEAMELYRKAAARGSVFAMHRIAELANTIAGLSPDFRFEGQGDEADDVALEQYYSLRDTLVDPKVTAFAWKAVAEMAGLPGFMSSAGSSPNDGFRSAGCDLAASIYTDLLARRTTLGLGAYPNDVPPAWIDAQAMGKTTGCEHQQAVQYDFSGCQQIRYAPQDGSETEADEVIFYVCDDS